MSWFNEEVGQSSSLAWPIELDLDALLGPGSGGVVVVNTESDPSAYTITGDYTSTGVYGDVAWSATDRLTLTAGVRWSEDKKDFCSMNVDPTLLGFQFLGPDTGGEFICDSATWSEVTPRVVVDYTIGDGIMLFGSYAKGYKGGGFNTAVAGSGPMGDQAPFSVVPFDPETSDAYELGVKATMLDGQMQLNAAYFNTDYKDLQLLVLDLSVSVINVDGVDVQGGEIEFQYSPAAAEGLDFTAYYTYTDSKIRAPGSSIDGSVTSDTPETTWGISANYIHDVGGAGTLDWFVGYNWQDKQLFDITGARFEQSDYGLLDAGVRFTHASQRWSMFLSGQNLTDEKYNVYGYDPLGLGTTLNRGYPLMAMFGFDLYLGDLN